VSQNLESSLEWRGLIREAKARYWAVAPYKKMMAWALHAMLTRKALEQHSLQRSTRITYNIGLSEIVYEHVR
jgi:hypothetical protein